MKDTDHLIPFIIDVLLEELDQRFKDWDEEWDGHIGDLSAPDYYMIMTEVQTLETIKRLVVHGNRRNTSISAKDYILSKSRNKRRRDLFKLALNNKKGVAS